MRYVDSKAFRRAMIDADFTTFSQVEETTGVYKGTISNIVNSGQKPNYETISKLVDAFHLRYDEIGRIFFANELAEMKE